LIQRLITILVALPVVSFLIYSGGHLFTLLLLFFSFMAVYEGRNLLLARGIHFSRLTFVFPLVYLISFSFGGASAALQSTIFGLLLVLTRQLLDFPKYNLVAAGANLLVVFYPTLLLGNMYLLRLQAGWMWAFFPLIAVWVYDAAAYVFGVRLGRIRMWASVSPKKSLEGALAGFIGSITVMLIFKTQLGIGILMALIFGVAIALAAHLGDLAESALKRYSGVKDSGAMFPGHGGVLDRLDSMMFASSVVYWLWSVTLALS